MKDFNNRAKSICRIFLQVSLISVITLLLLEISLGIFFKIKDRKLIDAETHDYPYLYFKLTECKGYRNEDGLKIFRSKNKPDNTFRIIIAGGSVVYGLDPENTISANFEKILRDSFPDRNIEVLNAGVPAYVIEQEFILIQLVLQYYEPDMIISIDGYNDLISTEINRFYPCPDVLPPHNWRDFRIISKNENSRSLSGRFLGMFPNISRLFDFFYRNTHHNRNSYSSLADNKEIIALTYSQRVKDIEAFCRAKGIKYYHFLQPLQFVDNPLNEREKQLASIYFCLNDSLSDLQYHKNLLFAIADEENSFTDECHLNKKGNNIIAEQIAEVLFPIITNELNDESENSENTEISNN
ncbi:MAG TPA: hypothetical protein PLL66_00335 [Bacteroidales bacterium]|nr:hypothetical protein [Bacteroidales bacterium]